MHLKLLHWRIVCDPAGTRKLLMESNSFTICCWVLRAQTVEWDGDLGSFLGSIHSSHSQSTAFKVTCDEAGRDQQLDWLLQPVRAAELWDDRANGNRRGETHQTHLKSFSIDALMSVSVWKCVEVKSTEMRPLSSARCGFSQQWNAPQDP